MLPINITTKTKTTFSCLSSSTTMGKVQGDSWTNEPREERSPSFRKVATRAHFGRVKEILTTNHSKSENQEEELKKLTWVNCEARENACD